MLRRLALALVFSIPALGVPGAFAQVVCEEVEDRPEGELTLRIEIERPLPDEVLAPGQGCTATVEVAGVYEAIGAGSQDIDFYVLLDSSGSTGGLSGADVDGNGSAMDLPADSIFHAELVAAQRFIEQLDPMRHRVAILTFSDQGLLEHALSPDLEAATDVLERLKSVMPLGGTNYSAGLSSMRMHAEAEGDFSRGQRGLFLSDGQPGDAAADIHLEARALEARGIRVDTFALGPLPGGGLELQDVASTTGGEFHALASPGDILVILPSLDVFDPAVSLNWLSEASGASGAVPHDWRTGVFSVDVELRSGFNRIQISLETREATPTRLDCAVEVWLEPALRPGDIGSTLRVTRSGASRQNLLLDWSGATPPALGESDLVLTTSDLARPFGTLYSGLFNRFFQGPLSTNAIDYIDVRRANCERFLSDD